MALLSYRSTPLRSGFSPGELMFGRPIKSSLGMSPKTNVDYESYEKIEEEQKLLLRRKWDRKHNARVLPPLEIGQKVWIKSPSDIGAEGIVVRKDENPHSYWINRGDNTIRRNRKHLFELPTENENVKSSIIPLALDDVLEESSNIRGSDFEDGNGVIEQNNASGEASARRLKDNSEETEQQGGTAIIGDGSSESGCDRPSMNVAMNDDDADSRSDSGVRTGSDTLEPTVSTEFVTKSGRTSKPRRHSDCLYY